MFNEYRIETIEIFVGQIIILSVVSVRRRKILLARSSSSKPGSTSPSSSSLPEHEIIAAFLGSGKK